MAIGGVYLKKTYITMQGDTWDMVSYRVYGNEHFMDLLVKANSPYQDIVIFPANIVLAVPAVEDPIVQSLPPWKRGTAS